MKLSGRFLVDLFGFLLLYGTRPKHSEGANYIRRYIPSYSRYNFPVIQIQSQGTRSYCNHKQFIADLLFKRISPIPTGSTLRVYSPRLVKTTPFALHSTMLQ